ncbi:hypothetical protein FF1_029537 [Malus domestica]
MVLCVPEDTKVSIGGRRIMGLRFIVKSKGEDEVKFIFDINGYICESIVLFSYVLSEEFGFAGTVSRNAKVVCFWGLLCNLGPRLEVLVQVSHGWNIFFLTIYVFWCCGLILIEA